MYFNVSALIRCLVASMAGTCRVKKSTLLSKASIDSIRSTRFERFQAASIESAGSNPMTCIPRDNDTSATREPMAPRPTIPIVRPYNSLPAKRFFSCSRSFAISSESSILPESVLAVGRAAPRVFTKSLP